MNKSMGMFFVASLSLVLLTSTIAIPLQASAEPDTTKVPVIILFNDKVSNQHKSLVSSTGGEITRTFTIINGMAANLPQNAIDALENNPSIASIHPDLEVHALEVEANTIIRATTVQSPPISNTGSGVTIAILDTGIMQLHPEFVGKVIDCKSVFSGTQSTCEDQHGHGTHVAGIVGGNGAIAAAKGVAPNVNFIIYKVLDSSGSGYFSGIIAAMEYVINENGDPLSRVISMSLGTGPVNPKNAPDCDGYYPPMDAATLAAKEAGVVVVAAAGNSGGRGVGLPACNSNTIAVAATNDSNNIASFSSRGGPVKDHGISAPGVSIYSSVPPTGASCCSHPSMYMKLSGTSMATPVVSGSIALLLEEKSDLTWDKIRNTLFTTACNSSSSPTCPTGDTPNKDYGYGRIDVLSAYDFLFPSAPIVNDPLTATGESYNTQEDMMLDVDAPGVLFNDTDPQDDSLTAVLDTDVTDGTLIFNADGSFSYDPDLNFNGVDSFTYHASDGTNYSNTVTVTITVNPEADPPTATADSYNTPEETLLTVVLPGILSNDTDPDGDSLTAELVLDSTAGGNLVLSADGSFTYDPDPGFVGTDSFTYRASDGTNYSNTVTVTINVNPEAGTDIVVDITYTSAGGKNGDKHLTHTISFEDENGSGISGVSVDVTLKNLSTGGSWVKTSATTGESGILSITLKNAPAGCYTTYLANQVLPGEWTWIGYPDDTRKELRGSCDSYLP